MDVNKADVMKVAVIGGGNGAFAAVADFTEAGLDVRWWRRGGDAGGGEITLTDHDGTRSVAARATADLTATLDGVDVVYLPVPATAQADIATVLAPVLKAGQVVLATPGSLGSWTMAEVHRSAGGEEGVIFAETGALPWIVRKSDMSSVVITTRATTLTVAALPASGTPRVADLLGQLFPSASVDMRRDVLDVALTNGNCVLHAPLVLMNTGVIATGAPFEPHGEGTQPPIRAVQDALDAERIAVREALGYGDPHYPLANFYAGNGWFYDKLGSDLPQAAPMPHEVIDLVTHRYVAEDIDIGLATLVGLARVAGVYAPLAQGFLAQAAAMDGRAPMAKARLPLDRETGGLLDLGGS